MYKSIFWPDLTDNVLTHVLCEKQLHSSMLNGLFDDCVCAKDKDSALQWKNCGFI